MSTRDAEVRHIGSITGDLASLDKALRRLISCGLPLHIVHEAWPCGFVISRHPPRRPAKNRDRHCVESTAAAERQAQSAADVSDAEDQGHGGGGPRAGWLRVGRRARSAALGLEGRQV